MTLRFLFYAGSLCLITSLLSACESKVLTAIPTAYSLLPEETFHKADWSPLKRLNYSAADDLFQKAQSRLSARKPVELIKLNNIGGPIGETTGSDAPITWLIPQQVGGRLAEIGMPVIQPRHTAPAQGVSPHTVNGTMPLQLIPDGSVNLPPSERARNKIYLEGDFAYLRDDLIVSLRLIDGYNNQILAVSDYNLPVTADIYALLDAKTAGGGFFGSGWMR